jgi:ubiquitin carboxyl-terminal hydrolase 35/38
MERVLRGVLTSDHPEKLKRALIAKLASTVSAEGGSPSEEVKSIFQLGIELLLSPESTSFECFAGSLVLNSWGNVFPSELQSSLTPEFMLSVVTLENVGVTIKIRAFRNWLESLRQIGADMSIHCGVVRLLLAGLAAYDKEIPLDLCPGVADILYEFPACLPIKDALPRFIGSMIRSLSVAPIEDAVCIQNIAAILGSIWSGQPSLLSESLMVIFDIISSMSDIEPTPALASVVQFIPYSLVSSATEAVLSNASITDEHVKLALQRMIDWLKWPKAVTVDKWVLAFLKALGHARKFSVLIHVAKGRVEQVRNRVTA